MKLWKEGEYETKSDFSNRNDIHRYNVVLLFII